MRLISRGLIRLIADLFRSMEVRERVGWNLRRLRAQRGVNQEDFAADSGFDRGYISGVERGVRNPSIGSLEKIAKAMDADVSEFFDLSAAKTFAIGYQKRD